MKSVLAVCTPIPFVKVKVNDKEYDRLAPITPQWHRCRMNLAQPIGYNVAEAYVDGMEVDEARNYAVNRAIEGGYKYLFFLDYDVLVPPKTLRKLVYLAENNPDRYVFGGIYCVKRTPIEPIIWRREFGCGIAWDWKVGTIIDDVVGIGCGCMLIRLSLFEKLSQPWFKTDEEYIDNGSGGEIMHKSTEDLYFCRKMVEETKTFITVDASLLCGHIDNSTGFLYKLSEDTLPFKI